MGHALMRPLPWLLLAALMSSLTPSHAAAQEAAFEVDEDPPESSAQPSPEDDRRARELFVLGDRLYEEGRYEASVTAFSEAYRLSHRPLLLFNLANAEERLGRLDAAAEHLRAYLPHAPDAEVSAVRSRLESIEERATAARAAAQAHGDDHGGADVHGGADASAGLIETPPPPVNTGVTMRRAGIGTMITGGVLVGAGVVFGILAKQARAAARAECTRVDASRFCTASAQSDLDSDSRNSLLADLGVGIGVAAAVTGLVLWLRGRSSTEPAITPSAVVDGHGAEVGVHVRF